MISQEDKSYIKTKEIMLGKKKMHPDLCPLADFINKKYNVKVINIVLDPFWNKPSLTVEICFEFEYEERSFYINPKEMFSNYDKKKQQIIAEEFKKIIKKRRYKNKDLWIIYSAFEPIAKEEANNKISQKELEFLQQRIGNEDIWKISPFFSNVTFFLHTDEQLRLYENSLEKRDWAEKYFSLLKAYDEFGYFKRDEFEILLDSKENFDNNFESNWYYYYK